MEICKNMSSGQYFIFIRQTGNDEFLLVTPEAQIKLLKSRLFDEVYEEDEYLLMENGLINKAQVQQFNNYKESRSDEIVELYEELQPSDQKRFDKIIEELQKRRK